MGRPGYYISDVADLIEFPRAPRPGTGTYKWKNTDLTHTTNEGIVWNYPQERRRVWQPTFRVSETDLAVFETLHLAVDGQDTPFYFVPDVDTPATAFKVRKEQGFDPQEMEERGVDSSAEGEQAFFDYTLVMTEEVSGTTIDA